MIGIGLPRMACHACHEPVVWGLRLDTGRPERFDYQPSPDGTWLVFEGEDHSILARLAIGPELTELAADLRVLHADTCPVTAARAA